MTPLDPIGVRLVGRVLIEASAGTGKTYTIATLYVRLLIERALDVASILVVTYTRAATAELRDRVRARLLLALAVLEGAGEDAELRRFFDGRADTGTRARDRALLTAALRDFDQAAIFTIHAFCQRVLTEHALQTELPFALQLAEHDVALIDDIAADYFAGLTFASPRETVAALRSGGVTPDKLSKLARQTVRDDGTRILPTPAPPAYDPALEAPFVEARERVAALWPKCRESLWPLLRDSVALKRNIYDPKRLPEWLAVLDGARSQPPEAWKFARNLTPAGLARGAKKGTTFDTSHPFYAAMEPLAAVVEALIQGRKGAAVCARRLLVDHARAALAHQHAERGELGFDDLLQALDRALAGPGGSALARTLAERLPVALIDEFQDTDPVQYRIFSRIYAADRTCLCMIGDPKQAIYGFRGADVQAYVAAAREAGAARHTLGVNWRSDPSMVGALNALYGRAPRPFLHDEIGFVKVDPRPGARDRLSADRDHALQVLWLPAPQGAELKGTFANEALPALIAGEITALLRRGLEIEDESDGRPRKRAVQPSDIAVLCRTNKQARATQTALAALSVPTVLDGDRSVFDGEMAVHLGRVLAAIAAPTDGRRLAAALLGPVLGVTPEGLGQMVQREEAFEPWLESLARWNELWRQRGFIRMFQALLDEARVQEIVLREQGGERMLTDLLHLGELLHETSSRERLGPEALLAWLGQRRREARDNFAEESAQLRLEHDERALRLTTVHRSKGLEYPIVFCPFSWGAPFRDDFARFHDADAGGAATIDLGSSELRAHLSLARDEDTAEGARLLYVALTRARHRTYLVAGPIEDALGSALSCLLYQRPGALDRQRVKDRLEKLSADAMLAEVRALAESSRGAIGVRAIDGSEPAPYRRTAEGERELRVRPRTQTLRAVVRATSFSRLVVAQSALDAALEADEHDVDADVPAPEAGAGAGEALPLLAPAKVVLHDFPAGPGPGTLMHAIYEHLDFPAADAAAVRAVAEPRVAAFGLGARVRLDALAEGVVQTLDSALDVEGTLRLRSIAARDRLNELEFMLCTQRAGRTLSPRALADALERHDALPEHRDYYARLGKLPAAAAAEHVKGFVDLVFRHGGRYYVADYKSNKLGEHAADYERGAVLQAMSEHHYFLQAYLYALALHRHLERRLAGYDYERCFGGVAYLFLRGMAPTHSPGSSVWLHRPSLAALSALGEALGEKGRDA